MNARDVLAATDLSPAADLALREAHGLATFREGRLHVLLDLPLGAPHAIDVQIPREGSDPATMEGQALELLRERVDAVLGKGAGEISLIVEHGSPDTMIVETARARRVGTVVIGATGRSLIERLLFGSVADHVVRHSPIPVMVARSTPGQGPVIAATDFSQTAKKAMLAAAEESRRRHCRLIVVHSIGVPILPAPALPGGPVVVPAVTPPTEALDAARVRLEGQLREDGVDGTPLVVEGHPADAILELARTEHAQLVAVGHSQHGGLTRLLLGSVSERVVREAPCSVLVVP